MENPHTMKTPRVEPMVEIAIQVVTCSLSVIAPMNTQPKTEATLKRMIVNVLIRLEAPRERAYVGR